MMDLRVTINIENAGLWINREFYMQIENTHGETPSADYFGDLQGLSNIENGDYWYLYQLYYNYTINKESFLVGFHDLNSEFLCSKDTGAFEIIGLTQKERNMCNCYWRA